MEGSMEEQAVPALNSHNVIMEKHPPSSYWRRVRYKAVEGLQERLTEQGPAPPHTHILNQWITSLPALITQVCLFSVKFELENFNLRDS